MQSVRCVSCAAPICIINILCSTTGHVSPDGGIIVGINTGTVMGQGGAVSGVHTCMYCCYCSKQYVCVHACVSMHVCVSVCVCMLHNSH